MATKLLRLRLRGPVACERRCRRTVPRIMVLRVLRDEFADSVVSVPHHHKGYSPVSHKIQYLAKGREIVAQTLCTPLKEGSHKLFNTPLISISRW